MTSFNLFASNSDRSDITSYGREPVKVPRWEMRATEKQLTGAMAAITKEESPSTNFVCGRFIGRTARIRDQHPFLSWPHGVGDFEKQIGEVLVASSNDATLIHCGNKLPIEF